MKNLKFIIMLGLLIKSGMIHAITIDELNNYIEITREQLQYTRHPVENPAPENIARVAQEMKTLGIADYDAHLREAIALKLIKGEKFKYRCDELGMLGDTHDARLVEQAQNIRRKKSDEACQQQQHEAKMMAHYNAIATSIAITMVSACIIVYCLVQKNKHDKNQSSQE